jgi:hypothetical protein
MLAVPIVVPPAWRFSVQVSVAYATHIIQMEASYVLPSWRVVSVCIAVNVAPDTNALEMAPE